MTGECLQHRLNLQLILHPFHSYSKLPKREAEIKMVFWCCASGRSFLVPDGITLPELLPFYLPFCLWLFRFLLVSSCSGRAVTGFGAGGGHARLPVPSELLALTPPAKLDGKARAETWDVCFSEGPYSSHSSQKRTKIRVL